jgi:hypothetical protein
MEYLFMTDLSAQNPANEWLFNQNSTFRTEFLTTITADAPVVFIRWRITLVAVMPIDRFGIYRAHVHANTALDAMIGHDIRSW